MVNEFHRQYLIPYLNFHRPCFFPETLTDTKGKQREQLMAWLSKRLQAQVGSPNLLPFEFDLLGGRLLPVLGVHAGQYLYERNNQRLSVYISGKKDAALPKSPECMNRDGEAPAQCAWQEGSLGFYVTAPVTVDELVSIALEIQKQVRER